MAFTNQEHCAVPGCSNACARSANLCGEHEVPGTTYSCEGGTCVITACYAEHKRRRGIILLNDFALGDLFGGADGFRTKLRSQGFSAIRISSKFPMRSQDRSADLE
jgi:hypothetical protein